MTRAVVICTWKCLVQSELANVAALVDLTCCLQWQVQVYSILRFEVVRFTRRFTIMQRAFTMIFDHA